MESAGQARWVVDVDDFGSQNACDMMTTLWGQRAEVKAQLEEEIPKVKQRARRSAEIVADWVRKHTRCTDTAGDD
jgi:polysaccharide pyruvyl transferase WcaK-like protein